MALALRNKRLLALLLITLIVVTTITSFIVGIGMVVHAGAHQSLIAPVTYTACHTCTVLSSEPEAMRCPSGDQATEVTVLECPV